MLLVATLTAIVAVLSALLLVERKVKLQEVRIRQ